MDAFGNIVVIGTTGSGKTTLAHDLAVRTGRIHIDLDDYHWLPNWVPRAPDDFRAHVTKALSALAPGQTWIISGNYSVVRDIVWLQAHTLVALDYAAPRVLWQLLRRTINRCLTRTPVCNGNIETWSGSFLSKDSIILWFFKSHWQKRRKLQLLIDNPGPYASLRIIRLKNPEMTKQWLMKLT